jgi:ArsR family transcriptional regulator, arsenate/arsenite/antimonite-responsive transcriptional repressor / arsenate reductase (thioredoxin)
VALRPTPPQHLDDVLRPDDVVITVCDSAHEELGAAAEWLHWSVADPVRRGDAAAFDHAVDDLAARVARLAPAVRPSHSAAGTPQLLAKEPGRCD